MSKDLGTLVIVVLKARNLKDKHSFYKQDVFSQVSLNGPPKRTAVDVKGGQHPVWDEEIRISVPKDSSEKNRTLEVSCWAKERRADDLLGQGKVDISETLQTGEFDDWIKLDIDGSYRGELYLEMTFFASGPAPLKRRMSKLHPNDRLTRPNQVYQYDDTSSTPSPSTSGGSSPHRNPAQPPPRTNLFPSSPRPTSSSPKNYNNALPPLPEENSNSSPPPIFHVPPSLAAGPAAATGAKKPHIPSILRPGNLKSSPTPVVFSRPTPEYTRPPQSQTRYPPPPASPSQPSSSYANTGPTPVSFPVASVPNAYSDLPPQYSFHPPKQQTQASFTPGTVDELPDPYLSARYQQPLPLPAGFSSQPSPPPQSQPSTHRDPAAEAAEIRRQAALQEEQERARKREQEEADAELARRLDRELNSEDENAGAPGAHMPGAW